MSARPSSVGEAPPAQTGTRPVIWRRNPFEWDATLGPMLLVPGVLILVLFMAYPFALGIWLSLTDATIGRGGHFVGLTNFITLLSDGIFQQTAQNTFVYAVITIPFKLFLGLGLALVLNNNLPYRNVIRAFVLLPWIVPTALSSLGWFMLYDAVFSPFSWLLRNLGLVNHNINFLGDATMAILSVCVANIWRGIPFFGISILAGLQAVPQELHEAAAIDGAGSWERFKAVTLPVIAGITLITTLFSIIWTFGDFQLIYVLTKGGPANATHIFGTYAYMVGLNATQIGQGAAIALYMFPILAVFAAILLAYLKREN